MNSTKDDRRRVLRQLGDLLSLGMVFPISISIGYGMGYYLDRWLGTSFLKLVFILFGIASGFISFYRIISKVEKEQQ